jgi:transposase
MVRLSDAGFHVPRIAAILDISEQRVRFWLKKYLEGGFDALSDAPHLGPPSRLTPKMLAELRAELSKEDRTWTATRLSEWLSDQFDIALCPKYLAYRLREEGVNWKRSRRVFSESIENNGRKTKNGKR